VRYLSLFVMCGLKTSWDSGENTVIVVQYFKILSLYVSTIFMYTFCFRAFENHGT